MNRMHTIQVPPSYDHAPIVPRSPVALVALALALSLLARAPGAASAATITVDDLADTSGGGTCTLRNAIDAANTDTAVGGCVAGAAGLDTIDFSVTGTITLGSGLVVSGDLAINGPGAPNLAISGSPLASPLLRVGAAVSLDGLTVGPSSLAGGIANYGTLIVTDSTFVGNVTSAPLAVTAGGGIANSGTLIVANSTFSGNAAGYGGGIFNNGTLTVSNSTFSENAGYGGGGIFNNGTLTVTNGTFSGNYGGGIYADGPYAITVIRNTIIVNSGGVAANCSGVVGGSDNLSDDATCPGFSIGDPMLVPIQVNAPGTTATFALAFGSAAIDAGDDAFCPATDQRGVARPQGSHCDIGAYESDLQPLCGNGVIESGEECDDGAASGTLPCGCTATCQLAPDADGDGLCDGLDPCTNVGLGRTFLRPKIVLSQTSGGYRMRLTSGFGSATDFSSLDPLADGARVLLANQAGGAVLDASLAPGPYGGGGTRGWTKNGKGTKWTFLDTTGAPNAGVYKMAIIDRSASAPKQVGVVVKGRDGAYLINFADVPVQATIVLGGQASSAAGECGESDFGSNDCTFNGGKVVCKK